MGESRDWCRAGVRLCIGVCLCFVLGLPLVGRAQHDPAETRIAMQQIFQDLRILMTHSVDPERFADPANRETIETALRSMARAADSLDSHTKGFDPGRRYFGRTLASDLRRAQYHFETRDHGRAEFFVQRTANACIGCHSRIESPADSPLASGFLDAQALDGIAPARRARLQIATRRFDDALATLERVFASPEARPAELLDPLTQYLSVAIRVKHDLKRPLKTLRSFVEREDLWTQLRADVETWIDALARFDESEPPTGLAAAKGLLAEAREVEDYPGARGALIQYLMASRILNETVAKASEPGAEHAEAYRLLGITETRIAADFWRSPAEFYLEQAIRLKPHSAVAVDAYSFLEEETILGFTGSAGTHLPGDVREHLNELRRLAEQRPASSEETP